MAKTYKYSNSGIPTYNGKDKIKTIFEGGLSTETRHVFSTILSNIDFKVSDDSIQAVRLATAIDEAEGQDVIEIGEGVYDWLKKKIKEVNREGRELLPAMFRVNGEVVNEYIKEGFIKPHQPAATKES